MCELEEVVFDISSEFQTLYENHQVQSSFYGRDDPKNSNLNKFYLDLPGCYELKDKNDETLLFESRFESGNLLKACKVD